MLKCDDYRCITDGTMIGGSSSTTKRGYETFSDAYLMSKQIVLAAVEKDEQSSKNAIPDEQKKREVMEMYRKAVKHFENALKVDKQSIPVAKMEEFEKRKSALIKNFNATKGRLSDLEKLYPPKARTRQRGLVNKPMVAVAPSSHHNRTTNSKPNDATDASYGRSRSILLKGVDEKLGGPLLSEILDHHDVRMSEIIGADSAKGALEEAVILPNINPSLFSGLRQPVQGILLFGPPGNGKTLLARALAAECGSTMFVNVSAATLTSKWVGEAEKIIMSLFKIARNGQPSIIFIDEIDSILCARNEKETEVSRRMKTEFLVQMDGMCSSKSDRLLVIGATNRPDELDSAVLRRFPKRILLDVPDAKSRIELLTVLLRKNKSPFNLSNSQLRTLSDRTKGYSNSDLVALCRDAAMVPIRELTPAQLKNTTEAQLRPIEYSDFDVALNSIKPSTNPQMLENLRKFAKNSGQSD